MNIIKYRDGILNSKSTVYCGRPKKQEYRDGELLIGLGNPFSWKKSKFVKFEVANLEECLVQYRKWLFKIIKAHLTNDISKLATWEQDYLEKFLELSQKVKQGKVTNLVCWCVNVKNYNPESKNEQCHAQILYKACIWYNSSKASYNQS
ncbi:hypothetical protein CAL7716_100300 (plasmid) [Calothrix sp. PCC 7716]|nr:hypothetical protein CAL7716_100300 [Calothrix sp. PCC 7716]